MPAVKRSMPQVPEGALIVSVPPVVVSNTRFPADARSNEGIRSEH